MESTSITHASTDVEYSPNRSKTLTSKLCEKEATETSSSNIHMKKFGNVFKFIPTRRPEQAKIGETISFIYNPENDSSVYWLQGVIEKRIDKYCDAKEAGFTKNRFKIGMIRIINLWGNYNPLPETFTMNLTKNGLWALGAIELPTLIIDELTAELNTKSGKCDKEAHEKDAPEIVRPRSFTKFTKNPEKTIAAGTKNGNDQKENYSTNYMQTKTIRALV